MVKLEARTYISKKDGSEHISYKIGMVNPATGFGMMGQDCIFGQFVMEPYIMPHQTVDKKTGQVSFFESINANVQWINVDYNQEPVPVPNNYGNWEMSFPASVSPILKAKPWVGCFFMIYLEPFKGPMGAARARWKLVETDSQGNVLPVKPTVQSQNVVPQNSGYPAVYLLYSAV